MATAAPLPPLPPPESPPPGSAEEGAASEQRRRAVGGTFGAGADAAAGDSREATQLTHEGAIYPSLWETSAPYLMEFFGVGVLTMTFMYNYSVNKDPVYTSTSNGLMVMALTYALSHVSGANLNPSVTISLLLTGRYTPRVAMKLCISQMMGAMAAATVRWQMSIVDVDIGPKAGHTFRAVIIVEILYTGMLCFVFLNCAASNKNNPVRNPNGFVGLAVGLCFIAGGYAASNISNTVMNSAIAVGLGFVDSKNGFSWTGVAYFLADTIGAFIGTALFRIVRPDEDNVGVARRDAEDLRRDTDSAKLFAEFIGAFYVIFTKALNRIGSDGSDTEIGPEAWSVAAALTAMVYSLRDVSGGYFNPAVTLSTSISGFGFCSLRVAFFYMVSQIFAAIAASSLFTAMNNGKGIPLTFGGGESVYAVMFAEGSFSFLITYVVLTMSIPMASAAVGSGSEATAKTPLKAAVGMKPGRRQPGPSDVAGFAYGSCHTAGGYAIGAISGSLLNPAVVLSFTGVDLLKGQVQAQVMAYIVYQVVGSLLGLGAWVVTHAGLYRQPKEEDLSGSDSPDESKSTA